MRILRAALLLTLATPAFGQEVAVPDAPVEKTVKGYRVTAFWQQRCSTVPGTFTPGKPCPPDWRFTITFNDDQGNVYTDEHYGPQLILDASGTLVDNPNAAEKFLKQMNTTNFSNISMARRLLQHLEDHGKLPPVTISGTPEAADGELFAVEKPKPTRPLPSPPPPPKVKK